MGSGKRAEGAFSTTMLHEGVKNRYTVSVAFTPFKTFSKVVDSPGSEGEWLLLALAIAAPVGFFVAATFLPETSQVALSFAERSAPIWLPLVLASMALHLWISFRRAAFISSQKYVLLEIKPPRTHAKMPIAMEAFLSGLHLHPGVGTWYARSILGRVRPWWSLEIASIEGQVHLFIWTREVFRRNIEANIYAQYPGAQVIEVPDYTRTISGSTSEWGIWGCDYDHTKPDPYPIKTYIDYDLVKPKKEYEQTDPLANLIEFMGTLGPGEQLWTQIIIREHRGEKYNKKNAKGEVYTWKDEARKLIQEIRIEAITKVKKYSASGEFLFEENAPNPTKGEAEKMAAIEHNVSKLAFDVGIRSVYLARQDRFKVATISGIVGLFKQFSSEGFNGFKPARWLMSFNDYPWEPFLNKRKDTARRKLVDAFRRRSYFYAPYTTPHLIMSTEELATIYHIPSAAVGTPSLPRVQSATATAPIDLPT